MCLHLAPPEPPRSRPSQEGRGDEGRYLAPWTNQIHQGAGPEWSGCNLRAADQSVSEGRSLPPNQSGRGAGFGAPGQSWRRAWSLSGPIRRGSAHLPGFPAKACSRACTQRPKPSGCRAPRKRLRVMDPAEAAQMGEAVAEKMLQYRRDASGWKNCWQKVSAGRGRPACRTQDPSLWGPPENSRLRPPGSGTRGAVGGPPAGGAQAQAGSPVHGAQAVPPAALQPLEAS